MAWLNMIGRRPNRDSEIDRELRFHIEHQIDDYVRLGMSRADATRRTHLEFGGVPQVTEDCREVFLVRWRDDLVRDVRFAIRGFRRSPGFFVAALATLALGIGASTAMFSVVNAVLLKPLAVPDADRLVRFVTINGGDPSPIAGAQEFDVWRRQSAFEDVAAHRLEFVNLTGGSMPEQIPAARVSQSFFPLFHATVILGRTFSSEDDRPGGPAVAVLSHSLWVRRFGSDPDIVGRTMSLGIVPTVIIGVLALDFDSEQFDPRPDVWVPFQINPNRVDGGDLFLVTGRVKPGQIDDVANAQLAVALATYQQSRSIRPTRPVVWEAQPLQDAMVRSVRASLRLLLAAVGLVMLIACANVASLLLVRGNVRRREMAIRIAIGAGRGQIIRQLLTESVVLSLAAGIVGFAVGALAVHGLLGAYPANNPFGVAAESDAIPRLGAAGAVLMADWRVIAFTVAISAVATVVFGVLPAFETGRLDVHAAMKETASSAGLRFRRPRARTALVVAEIALALVLVVGAALLIRTSLALRAVSPGFESDHVLTMRMSVSGTPLETRAGIDALTRNGAEGIHAVPGVLRASTTCCMPLETVWQLPFVVSSRAGTGLRRTGNLAFHAFGGWTFVSPGYFDVFRIPILKGRDFTAHDAAGAPGVVIINEAMARRFWPDSDPLADQLIIGRGMRPEYDEDPVRQIIGIVGDVRDTALNRNPRPEMYVPVAQVPDGVTKLNVRLLPLVWIVRTAVEPYSVSRPVADALESASGGLPVSRVRSMSDVVSESMARTRFDMWLMTIFGCVALGLAAIGIYGLMAYMVRQRTQEIGIRLALGQDSRSIRNLVVMEGVRVALIGAAIGVAAAYVAVRVLASLLFGVQPHDPIVFTIVFLTFVAVATLASYVPARRAMTVDPLVALRCE